MTKRNHPHEPIMMLRYILLDLSNEGSGVQFCESPTDVEIVVDQISRAFGKDLVSPELVDLIYATWLFYETRLALKPLPKHQLRAVVAARAEAVAAVNRASQDS